jgi:hypothetical protein
MIVVVSGLPRSGTSMMMQMLQAGGVPLCTDGARGTDASNPRGYFEDARVKRLVQDAAWLDAAEGHALKVVAPLVPHLPPGRTYRVVVMDRDLDEVLASQARMLERAGQTGAPPAVLRPVFAKQLRQAEAWLDAHAETLRVPHRTAIEAPEAEAARVAAFLRAGGVPEATGAALDPAAMAAVVDPDLHRHRVPAP